MDMDMDIPSIDIWGLLFERNPPYPNDHTLFESPDSSTKYTLNDVRLHARSFGHALQHHWSWRKGDVLVVMAPNHIDVPAVTWGCHWAGGVVAPVNPALSAGELLVQLQSSRAGGLVVHPDALAAAREAARRADIPDERVLVLGEALAQFLHTPAQPSTQRVVNDPADTAFLVYSSGTTGRPKGVMISHRNVVAGVLLQSRVDGPHVHFTRDRLLAALPIYHIYGLVCQVHLPAYLGLRTVFMPRFDIHTFCSLVHTHAITLAYVAPPIVLHLARSRTLSNDALRSLRMLTSGGAPLAPALIGEVRATRGIPVRQAYGLSETTAVCHIQRWTTWQHAPGSNGPPLPGVEARIVHPNGDDASPGQEGELWVRGPTVFTGYRDEAALTEAVLSADGWFATGDIGYADAGGNLFITDRAKDMIKVKGWAVAPAEVEDVLLGYGAVEDAAVIGVLNEDLQSEVPLAYVVLKAGVEPSQDTAAAIVQHVKERVVQYKQLRGGVVFTEQIPKSPSGKILKRALRERLRGENKVMGAVEYSRYRTKL